MMSVPGASATPTPGTSGTNDDEDPKANLTRLKKRLTLDLEAPKSARKQRMNELLSTPELDKLILTTPELDRLCREQSGMTVIGAMSATSSFLNPKHVPEEAEEYVKPFEAALAQLRESNSVPGLRYAPFPESFPPDLTDVPIGRSVQKQELPSPREERDPERFHAIASTMALAGVSRMGELPFGYPIPHPQEMDIKPSIKEEPLDVTDYSSMGEASCSAYGSSDSSSPDPSSSGCSSLRRRSAGSRNSTSEASFGVSPIDMEDQELKKLERKRLRNRIAASKCRARKLERISRLEDRVKQLKVENADLATVVHRLRDTIDSLKEEIVDHVQSGCDIPLPTGFLSSPDSSASGSMNS